MKGITIVGAGAIGGVVGAYLAKGGVDVTFVDINPDHVNKINQEGLTIKGNKETFTAEAKALTLEQFIDCGQKVGKVLLCVKAQHTRESIRSFKHLLEDNGYVVSFQNGLNEQIIADEIGMDRTVGCFVNLFADYLGPGLIQYGGVGSVYIGELDGNLSDRVKEIVSGLSLWGEAKATTNILGFLWSKIAYGAVLTASATSDETIADFLDNLTYRDMTLHLATEILSVAGRKNIAPEGFDDWEPSLVYSEQNRDEEKLGEQLNQLVTRLRSYTKTRTGIWRDLVVRKRKTEVPEQLLPVIKEGEELGFSMTLTKAVLQMIQEIETGVRQISIENLEELKAIYPREVKQNIS